MKINKTTILLVLICLGGLSLLMYPKISNYVNAKSATKAVASYDEIVRNLDEERNMELWSKAVEFNKALARRTNPFDLDDGTRNQYRQILDVDGNGLMGYIEIPKIGVELPIYHGCDDKTLQSSVGHVEWSSIPTGGLGNHTVLSGHRGLPSAKLFTDLDELREGDIFTITVIDNVLTYEVDQIRVVLPSETADMQTEKDKDFCTLLTCTPYGINTHRLLVRGHRIENAADSDVRIVSELVIVDPFIVAPLLALPFLLGFLLVVLLKKPSGQFKNARHYFDKRSLESEVMEKEGEVRGFFNILRRALGMPVKEKKKK